MVYERPLKRKEINQTKHWYQYCYKRDYEAHSLK